MIYGMIPVGGRATRLGVTFSKEMLPLLGEEKYRPVMDITVANMQDAGATAIYAVHGMQPKPEIVSYYKDMFHLIQPKPSFGGILKSFYYATEDILLDSDTVLLGLPDSVYFDNMFAQMLKPAYKPVLGCFLAGDTMRVDRLMAEGNILDIKSPYKHNYNSAWFWAGIAFNGKYIKDVFQAGLLKDLNEIGSLLNETGFVAEPFGGSYYDTGTWQGYNEGMRAYDTNKSRRSRSF